MTESERKSRGIRRFHWTLLITVALVGALMLNQLVSAGGNLVVEARKLAAIMKLIQTAYVEDPDLEKLTEGAIEGMLKRLDPHSIYIPPKEQEEITERDVGEFSGIGISFVIQNELITVLSPINGTPADRLGVRAGDRIIEIDGVSAYGITNDEVFKKLRGPKGTTVKIKIVREGYTDPIDFTIVRDTIPIHSIVTSFMIDDSTGYILLNQFMATTTAELERSLDDLEARGMTRLIFDLRNNEGGRLNEALGVADKFIPGGHVITSRRGRLADEDTTYYSTDDATHAMFDLIMLINGGSASASEIVSGAVQDLDRGLIVGSKSFGKGLVQRVYPLQGGAVIRLSTAHWYTPSGRLVQRPYDKGRGEYYAVRYRDPDSVKAPEDREAYQTLGGRTVYASSGITPDVDVEPGTYTVGTARLLSAQILFSLAEQLIHEEKLDSTLSFKRFLSDYNVSDESLRRVIDLAKEKDLTYTDEIYQKDRDFLANQVKAEMAQLIWNNRDCYYQVRISGDSVVMRARELFPQAKEIAAHWLKR